MTWRALSIRRFPAAEHDDQTPPCQCLHQQGRPHPPTHLVQWLDEETGVVKQRAHCANRASAIASEFDLRPWPLGPGVEIARPGAAQREQAGSP